MTFIDFKLKEWSQGTLMTFIHQLENSHFLKEVLLGAAWIVPLHTAIIIINRQLASV